MDHQQETTKIKLDLAEFENFIAIAETFNVKYEWKNLRDGYEVKAPRDKLLQWGYLEDNEPDE